MTLDEFEQKLRKLVSRPTDLRPFICEGSPLDCKVFIVGFNPATPMSSDWWEFWRAGYGYDKAAWFDRYKADRMAAPLKKGKTRRQTISPSRRVIEAIVKAAAPVRVLETNIYPPPTTEMAGLPKGKRDTELLRFLLKTIQPTMIVTHGKQAAEVVQDLNPSGMIRKEDHFSRGWSNDKARDLGEKIKKKVTGR